MKIENYAETFITRMHEIMEIRNISENELFSEAEYTEEEIELFKNGEFGVLDYDVVARIPYLLNVSMDYLMGVIDNYDEKPLDVLHRQISYALLVADDNKTQSEVIADAFQRAITYIESANYPDDVMNEFLNQIENLQKQIKSHINDELSNNE